MTHGDRAKRQGNWMRGREYWGRRPMKMGSGGGDHHNRNSDKRLTHRIERARAKMNTYKRVKEATDE